MRVTYDEEKSTWTLPYTLTIPEQTFYNQTPRAIVDAEGTLRAVWSGRDDGGREVAPGVYFYRLDAGEYSSTRRVTLID